MSIDIKKSLTNFSLSDFFHDFSFTGKQLGNIKSKLRKSKPIGSKVGYQVAVLNLLPNIHTIYDFFKDHYKTLLPADSVGEAFKEDVLLSENIGFDYVGIRNKLMAFDITTHKLPDPIPITIGAKGGTQENYEVRCFPTKNCGKYYNLPQAFKSTTKSSKFVIIIDASFISLSGLRLNEILKNTYLQNYNKEEKYHFYILQNNENLSDSATKISSIDGGNENIIIHYLRDKKETTVTYDSFNDNNVKLENLYSKIEIQTKNTNGKINALLKYKDNAFERNDVGDISTITEASFLALQSYIETKKFSEECLSYFLLKRAGDWCQALSLLDTKREYSIFDDADTGKTTSL